LEDPNAAGRMCHLLDFFSLTIFLNFLFLNNFNLCSLDIMAKNKIKGKWCEDLKKEKNRDKRKAVTKTNKTRGGEKGFFSN